MDWKKFFTDSFYRNKIMFILGMTFVLLLAVAGGVWAVFYAGSLLCLDIGVHPSGVGLMLFAVALNCFSGRISKMLFRQQKKSQRAKGTIKTISLIICAGGALLAILG